MAVAALTLASCGGKNTANVEKETVDTLDEATVCDLNGKWYIENVVVNDSLSARPAEVTPDTKQYINFNADSTYFISTNCNSISGTYVVKGDSLTLDPGAMTEMACENMVVEDLLRQVIPSIATVNVENDSITRLCGADGKYIELRKAAEETAAE